MKNKKWIFCILIIAIFMFTSFCSVIIIEHEHTHNCIGEHCLICYRISAIKNTLKILSCVVITPLVYNIIKYIKLSIKRSFNYNPLSINSVSLKDKLTN